MKKCRAIPYLAFIALLINSSLSMAQPVQWSVEQGGNGHWYQAVGTCPEKGGIQWSEAEAYAEGVGGHLATIASEGENQFVFNLVNEIKYWFPEPGYNQYVGPWLGGRQDDGAFEPGGNWQWIKEGYFMDSTGQASGYTNWNPGEPNNALDGVHGQENAIIFHAINSLKPSPYWNDIPAVGRDFWRPKGFVVESDTRFDTLPDWCGEVSDPDHDGIFINDKCPNSNLSRTVIINGCDSRVVNALFSTGCTISDLIACPGKKQGAFVSCVSSVTGRLKQAGTITGQQYGAIQRCAAKAKSR